MQSTAIWCYKYWSLYSSSFPKVNDQLPDRNLNVYLLNSYSMCKCGPSFLMAMERFLDVCINCWWEHFPSRYGEKKMQESFYCALLYWQLQCVKVELDIIIVMCFGLQLSLHSITKNTVQRLKGTLYPKELMLCINTHTVKREKGKERHRDMKQLVQGSPVYRWQSWNWNPSHIMVTKFNDILTINCTASNLFLCMGKKTGGDLGSYFISQCWSCRYF